MNSPNKDSGLLRRICKGGQSVSLGQDLAFSPATLRGASPFPPIWRIWPDAANFGIRRRRCDSPVSQFTQNFPIHPALNWMERFAEEPLDQEHRSLYLKALFSSFSMARYILLLTGTKTGNRNLLFSGNPDALSSN